MSIRGNTSGEFFGEWFGPVEVVPGAMFANLQGAGSVTALLTGVQVQSFVGGGAIYPPEWYGKDRRADPELREKLRALFQGTPEPVREAIEAQSTAPFESFEAEERKLREATEAAQIEYQALYMRLLAYQREEMLMEEEAIVMTMFAVLSR